MAQITDVHGNVHEVASNSKANTGVALGATGLGLSVLNGLNNGGGLLGGLFGGGRNANAPNGGYVTEKESALQMQIAALEARNQSVASATEAFEKSAAYTTRLHNEQSANIKTLLEQSITQGVALQRVDDKINTEVALLRGEINTKAALAAKDMEALAKDIQIEAERRSCGDNSIVSYVNQTFYAKQVADVETSNDTTSQTTYNPLPCYKSCYCGN